MTIIYDVDDNIIIDNDDDDITVASVVGLLLPIALWGPSQ